MIRSVRLGRSALTLAALAFVVSAPPSFGDPAPAYRWPVLSIYDGDSFTVRMEPAPTRLLVQRVGLAGADSPELGRRAKCDAERELADRARALTASFLAAGEPVFHIVGSGKFGRLEVRVSVAGADLVDALVEAGLARRWDGRGRPPSWCP